MKTDKFNKIGDTSYRFGKQIQGYVLIIEFLEKFIKKDKAVIELDANNLNKEFIESVSYTHLTLPTNVSMCRSRWSPYH